MNQPTLRLRIAAMHLLFGMAWAAAAAGASADVVTDWNAVAFDTMKAANVAGAPAATLAAAVGLHRTVGVSHRLDLALVVLLLGGALAAALARDRDWLAGVLAAPGAVLVVGALGRGRPHWVAPLVAGSIVAGTAALTAFERRRRSVTGFLLARTLTKARPLQRAPA